jgi:hypothetical protein
MPRRGGEILLFLARYGRWMRYKSLKYFGSAVDSSEKTGGLTAELTASEQRNNSEKQRRIVTVE